MNNAIKFQYIKQLWHLEDGVIKTSWGNKAIKFRPDCRGYLSTTAFRNGKKFSIKQHEAVFMIYYNRPIAEGKEVHHKDGNPANNAIDNLIELTPTQHKRIHKYQNDDPMRAISLYKGAWRFQWNDDNGRHRLRHFRSINEAMTFRAEIEEPRRQELRALGLNCKRAGNMLTTATMRQINKRDRLSYRCRH
ncbi:TPA: HNH endonuclease [Escherichia coli]